MTDTEDISQPLLSSSSSNHLRQRSQLATSHQDGIELQSVKMDNGHLDSGLSDKEKENHDHGMDIQKLEQENENQQLPKKDRDAIILLVVLCE